MCKTLYDMFLNEPNEQQLYHAIATVATLLLQIGEVGKRFNRSDHLATSRFPVCESINSIAFTECKHGESAADELGGALDTSLDSSQSKDTNVKAVSTSLEMAEAVDWAKSYENRKAPAVERQTDHDTSLDNPRVDLEWSISFEQFLASMLTEPELVGYFDAQIDLNPAIEHFRNRRLRRQTTSGESPSV